MAFFSKLTGLFKGGERKSNLQKNMEKALHMKQEAGRQTSIPEHRTGHGGMHATDDPNRGSHKGNEATFTPQLKHTRVSRSGDT
jgi:hypothetical protein